MNPATENLLGVRVEQKLSFDEMFADLDMPDTDETVSRSFLTNEITRFGRVLSVTLASFSAILVHCSPMLKADHIFELLACHKVL